MHVLIVTAAGTSDRFGGETKWALRDPRTGHSLLHCAVDGVKGWDRLVVAVRRHPKEHPAEDWAVRELGMMGADVVKVGETASHAETAQKTIALACRPDDVVTIRDADNRVDLHLRSCNAIGVYVPKSGRDRLRTDAKGKAGVRRSKNRVTNIFERRGNADACFSVGCITFASAEQARVLLDDGVARISTGIQRLIDRGEQVAAIESKAFDDWGTRAAWERYVAESKA